MVKKNVWFAACIPPVPGGVKHNMEGFAKTLARYENVQTTMILPQYRLFQRQSVYVFWLFVKVLFSKKAPDWIIARSSDAVVCAIARRLHLIKSDVILHSHGWEELCFDIAKKKGVSFFSWRSRYIKFPLLRVTLCFCKYCICGTLQDCSYIRAKYPAYARKIKWIPHGVTDRKISHSESNEQLRFIAVTSDSWRKNNALLYSFFSIIRRLHKNCTLDIVGSTFMASQPSENITSHGLITQVQLLSLSCTVGFCLHFSEYEGGYARGILEPMSCGVIPITLYKPHYTEFLQNTVNAFFLRDCSEEKVKEVLLKINQRHEVQRMQKAAITKAHRMRWQRNAHRLARIL